MSAPGGSSETRRRARPATRRAGSAAAGLLVTGTDTGVGKTLVACGLVAAWRQRGVSVAVLKPAESGCPRGAAGRLVPQDALRLRAAAGARALPLAAVCPYPLAAPLAPAAAAEAAGVRISTARLDSAYREAAARAQVVVVEGAGGLLVPLAGARGRVVTYADLARRWGLAVVVVAPARLGVINHVALTTAVARAAALRVLGAVLDRLAPRAGSSLRSNPRWIEAVAGTPVLGTVPYLPRAATLPPARLARYLARALDCEALLARLVRSTRRRANRSA